MKKKNEQQVSQEHENQIHILDDSAWLHRYQPEISEEERQSLELRRKQRRAEYERRINSWHYKLRSKVKRKTYPFYYVYICLYYDHIRPVLVFLRIKRKLEY